MLVTTSWFCSKQNLVRLLGVLGLFLHLAASEQLGEAVPNAAEEECAEQVLERSEGI